MRYGKTLKAKTHQHTYEEAHVYADAALAEDGVSEMEARILPLEFMVADGLLRGKLEVILQRGKETNRNFLEMLSPNVPKSPKARNRNVLTSVAYTPHNGKSHVSRGPYQPERFHWTPSKGDSGRELKFIFHYAAVLDAEKARAAKKSYVFGKANSFEQGIPPSLPKEPAPLFQTKLPSATPQHTQGASKCVKGSGFQTIFGLQDDCDDEEPMPSKRIKTEPVDHEASKKTPNEPTSVS
ncbi:hypothetical protein KC332_g11828 [Hortaea werneckii]|nr:hypothetical protein KC358_g5913 [Hortaea werneckii]KAI6841594.1 hypothetical protein KC350_g5201 [Hortaea werneckii]KAI6935502.1 hypothetical protein KC348_g6214 [Hortaea werneckii]KAI6937177.1 hypothetical protein KC341_g5738 [Hortaea werneckii]KAI6962455.1 hypothetical protein KC321_g11748 [Hortaea werneckii]